MVTIITMRFQDLNSQNGGVEGGIYIVISQTNNDPVSH